MRGATRAAVLAIVMLGLAAPGAAARSQTVKKGIWGPLSVDGRSQFPIYRELGAGVYNTRLRWSETAATRPARARDPRDPAYRWPAELDVAVRQARRNGMRVAVELAGSPAWANGGKTPNWAPDRPADFAAFAAAAARRYPSVRYWVIWGEPVRRANWMPMERVPAWKGLTREQARAPERYAILLDRAYGAIKSVDRDALVVGGNSFTNGDIGPRNWIRHLDLPSGRPPRMDLYGHNPFAAREPDLADSQIRQGMADFGDLDLLARWVDRDLGRTPRGKRIKLFLGEYAIPTDHANRIFGWWVTRRTQARWIRSALRITRRWSRIETLGYFSLYDEPASPAGDEMDRGLIDEEGRRKPGFYAFKRG